jgi:hypothetical protein
LLLDLSKFHHQLVIFKIADNWVIEHMISVTVVIDDLAELLQA